MNLHPLMAQALKPWMPPVNDDPREQLLLEEDDLDPEEPDAEPVMEKGYCPDCNGTGEGFTERDTCSSCRGTGLAWVEVKP